MRIERRWYVFFCSVSFTLDWHTFGLGALFDYIPRAGKLKWVLGLGVIVGPVTFSVSF